MKKQTKVLLAASMLTLGASFSAMAAEKGTWDMSTGEWMCYNEDGEEYVDTWCLSLGVEYYMDEDGVLGSSTWVHDEEKDHFYYAQSDGSKTINAWKYILPFEAEDEDTEGWYWFDAKGRMISNTKKTIGDYTYYFGEDGKLLTGWIEVATDEEGDTTYVEADADTAVDKLIYANEDGSRAGNTWLETFKPGTDEDEAYEEDKVWYYINSNGKPATGKKSVGDYTYFFGANDAILMTDWVGYDGENYIEATNAASTYEALYWVGGEDTGYVRKNGWRKLANTVDVANEVEDPDTYWFYFDKNGKAFIPELASDAVAVKSVTFKNGEKNDIQIATATNAMEFKKINNEYYLFNANGQMQSGLKEIANEINYLGTSAQGQRKTGEFTIADKEDNEYTFMFAPKNDDEEGYDKYVAITGNYDGYLYNKGQLIVSEEKGIFRMFTTDDDDTFVVDYTGKIQKSAKKTYELEDGTEWKLPEGYEFDTTDGIGEYAIVKAEEDAE